jgi:hypothetical protein
MSLCDHGYCIFATKPSGEILNALRDSLFRDSSAGERCLLDHPLVQETAIQLKDELTTTGHLDKHAVTIQAIAFNKTAATNWKVAWHQDLMFPFSKKVSTDIPSHPTKASTSPPFRLSLRRSDPGNLASRRLTDFLKTENSQTNKLI